MIYRLLTHRVSCRAQRFVTSGVTHQRTVWPSQKSSQLDGVSVLAQRRTWTWVRVCKIRMLGAILQMLTMSGTKSSAQTWFTFLTSLLIDSLLIKSLTAQATWQSRELGKRERNAAFSDSCPEQTLKCYRRLFELLQKSGQTWRWHLLVLFCTEMVFPGYFYKGEAVAQRVRVSER